MGASPQKKSKTKSKLHFTSSVALRNTEEKCCDVMDAVPKKNQNQDCSSHLQSRGSKIKKCIPHWQSRCETSRRVISQARVDILQKRKCVAFVYDKLKKKSSNCMHTFVSFTAKHQGKCSHRPWHMSFFSKKWAAQSLRRVNRGNFPAKCAVKWFFWEFSREMRGEMMGAGQWDILKSEMQSQCIYSKCCGFWKICRETPRKCAV